MEIKKVLVVPLNWGLGHTTRLIPIISFLRDLGADVTFGGGVTQIALIKQEFDSLRFVQLPSVNIRIGKPEFQHISFLIQVPGFLCQILREHKFLKKLIRKEPFDMVISDNAYGLWNKRLHSVLITHQLTIRLPGQLNWMQYFVNRINRRLISNFDECWIPDTEGNENLAGELSHFDTNSKKVKNIGILSRFNSFAQEIVDVPVTKNFVLILLSGPEPQRSRFENLIAEQLIDLADNIKFCIVRGLPEGADTIAGNEWKNHLPASGLRNLIAEAEFIICRSGYSSIMDLVSMNKKALLVPTPGQPEQEYLASRMSEKGWFPVMNQDQFNLNKAIQILRVQSEFSNSNHPFKQLRKNNDLLRNSIIESLNKC